MQILARAVGRRREAVAQIQIIKGTGKFIINNKPAEQYLQNNACALISIKSPFSLCQLPAANSLETVTVPSTDLASSSDSAVKIEPNGLEVAGIQDTHATSLQLNVDQIDTIVKVKGGGLMGQTDAIKLGVARAICSINDFSLFISSVIPASSSTASLLQVDSAAKQLTEELTEKVELTEEVGVTVTPSISTLQDVRKLLKTKGYLTQDSRVKERRKYGLKKARKASQYHKR